MSNKQVISKQRVSDHGEVFTHPREVNAMLDLVKPETERIESRFLEPACGTGNFLVEILSRKLAVVAARYGKAQAEYERYAVLAISSLYGIDILADNVAACRERLFEVFNTQYTARFKNQSQDTCRNAVRYLLNCNILHGDALSLHTVATATEPAHPIIFAEWTAVNGSLIKRRDYVFDDLVKFSAPPPPDDLFSPENIMNTSRMNNGGSLQSSDLGDYSYQVHSVKDYPLIHFLDLGKELFNKEQSND
jgi:SAM-dependent methyltransferase